MDQLSEEVRQESPWTMMFADDIVICSESRGAGGGKPGEVEVCAGEKRNEVIEMLSRLRCGQTSCWSEKGFSISHDQYLKGDFSLTITAADYSQRKVYACECGDIDYSYVRLVIETVFSPVQMEFHEDLKLHVSVPEPVEVIYKSSGSADEVICRVNNLSLQCKDEYRDRTSLTYPEITLRHVEPRDSGSYTIRDTENEQDIQIYAVSVEGPGFPVWGIVLIVLICCCVAVGMYFWQRQLMRKHLMRKTDKPDVPVWRIVLIVMSLLCCVAEGMSILQRYRMRKTVCVSVHVYVLCVGNALLAEIPYEKNSVCVFVVCGVCCVCVGNALLAEIPYEKNSVCVFVVCVYKPDVPVWGIVLIVMSLLCCVAEEMSIVWKHHMREHLMGKHLIIKQCACCVCCVCRKCPLCENTDSEKQRVY
ncbi:hypothetical protein QTP70_003393, partial [Hemibagrus guttatus]